MIRENDLERREDERNRVATFWVAKGSLENHRRVRVLGEPPVILMHWAPYLVQPRLLRLFV